MAPMVDTDELLGPRELAGGRGPAHPESTSPNQRRGTASVVGWPAERSDRRPG